MPDFSYVVVLNQFLVEVTHLILPSSLICNLLPVINPYHAVLNLYRLVK